jgi:UDPglucose 6-dehydrogenase
VKISVLGTGYVGLVTGVCLAELGNHVSCVDVDKEKIAALQNGQIPIYEPGLEELVKRNHAQGRLEFVTDLAQQKETADVYYVAVGTPTSQSGAANLQYVISAVKSIGQTIDSYCVIIDKSTVPVGVADKVEAAIQEELDKRGLSDVEFDVVSNPEFLKEGAAIADFMKPDRLVVGHPNKRSKEVLENLYTPILRNHGGSQILYMNVKDAEMTKYAANAMLATRISFMNEVASLCEKLDVDVENVRLGIGSDSRIGNKFLHPGCGYGGSCFPKDVKALINMAELVGFDSVVLKAVEERNALQKRVLSERVLAIFGKDLSGLKIAVWGLSFKPGTDDMREASSVVFINEVIASGATVCAYDPEAMAVAKPCFDKALFDQGKLTFVDVQNQALDAADILVVITEWKSFLNLNTDDAKKRMKHAMIIDGRNIYDPVQMREAGFIYSGIGRGKVS